MLFLKLALTAMIGIFLITVALIIFSGCTLVPVTPKPPTNASQCDEAEVHIKALGCMRLDGETPLWRNRDGETWGQTCRINLANHIDLNPGCVLDAKTCEEMKICPVRAM